MIRKSYIGYFLSFLFILPVLLSACKKEQMLTHGGQISFSVDTLMFDTVFTAQGSFTMGMKIYNRQAQKIKISSIRLAQGNESQFHLNVDGIQGNIVEDLELAANDSIYVFATVNINPTDENSPFVVEDRLIASFNGQEYTVPFIAFGQNAYYIVSALLGSGTLKTDKPYVIINNAAIAENEVLTIPPGCRIYMHADSRLFVLGRLIAKGTKQDSIVFQGDRLDRAYFGHVGYPGEWGGIYFFEQSYGNELEWVVLKNCGNGAGGAVPAAIQVTGDASVGEKVQLTLRHSIIENSIGYGIVSFQGNFVMENSLVHSTGTSALAIFQGGTYKIRNCDFINYYPARVDHTEYPTVSVLSHLDTGNKYEQFIGANLKAEFTNCLIYGSLEDELVVRRKGNNQFDVLFDHCLIKSSQKDNIIDPNTRVVSCKFNEDPHFANYAETNYRPADINSPLVDAGTGSWNEVDLDGKPRTVRQIDIGCYEMP